MVITNHRNAEYRYRLSNIFCLCNSARIVGLFDHANGIEPCTIADIHNYQAKSHSLSNGQILFEDYNFDDAQIVMQEMVDNLVLELVEKNLVADEISLSVGYSRDVRRASGGQS